MIQCNVTFLNHSGFLVETEESYLLFDYWKGELPSLNYHKKLYVFASHSHHDHYSKEIYKLESKCKEVQYILSSDIKTEDGSWKKAEHVTFLSPYENVELGDCRIETLRSTDLGLAFLVYADGISIYHAGDLHWWEWPGEPEEENQAYIRDYKAEIARIAGRKLDLAFVVLDPRQEEAGGRGMDYFLEQVGARYVFPMHLWEDYRLIQNYIAQNQKKYITSKIMDIHKAGDRFSVFL